MISYTIDPSLLSPPIAINKMGIEDLNSYYCSITKNIKLLRDLSKREDIAIYFSTKFKNNFISSINSSLLCSYFPMDILRRDINDILSRDNRHYFEPWFNIYGIQYSLDKIDLALFLKHLSALNHFVYKKSDYHYFVYNESRSCKVETNITIKKTDLSLRQILFDNLRFPCNFSSEISKKSITELHDIRNTEYEEFKTVESAINAAREKYSDLLIFGKDVNKGLETIDETAGPPTRVFYYLKTLYEYAVHKKKFERNYKRSEFEAYVCKCFGCDSSPNNVKEHDWIFKDEKGKNQGFTLHLKPSSIQDEVKNTVRIFFKWNNDGEKVLIGWIGCHPDIRSFSFNFKRM
jgi:hypothetical protein